MSAPTFLLLLVDDPAASGAFYARLLGREPIESSPTFVMIPVAEGVMLGLWSRHTVEPAPTGTGGLSEIGLVVADVDATHAAWVAQGMRIAQAPTDLDFGRTCVGLDPDGHRIRALRPAE